MDVGLGDLLRAALSPQRVLRVDHLLDVVDLVLGLDLGRPGRLPVEEVGNAVPLEQARERDHDHEEQDEKPEGEGYEDHLPPLRLQSSAVADALIIDAVRTPMGAYRGGLSGIRPDDLAAHVISAAVERTGLDPSRIDDVYMGAANQSGEDNRDVARMGALLAGPARSMSRG